MGAGSHRVRRYLDSEGVSHTPGEELDLGGTPKLEGGYSMWGHHTQPGDIRHGGHRTAGSCQSWGEGHTAREVIHLREFTQCVGDHTAEEGSGLGCHSLEGITGAEGAELTGGS